MKKQYFIVLIVSLISFISCANKESINPSNTDKGIIRLSALNDPDYMPHTVNEALPGKYDTYLKYFAGTDYEVGISSKKEGALTGGRIISCISGASEIQPLKTKGSYNELPSLVSFIDGIEISQQNITGASTKGEKNGLKNSFGKTVTFTFHKQSPTKSMTQDAGRTDLYIPKEIDILAPAAKEEKDLNPLCYYKNFLIKWNEDCNNENGVLVIVEWYGGMVLGDDIENTCVRRVVSFPDTGRAVLPESFFEGIPDTAYCNLTLLRGNVDNVSDGQYSYKVLGETHQRISFILIRHIREK